jgi:SAM-dependent methyltransferase
MTESATRSGYDSVAVLYADMFRDAMDDQPLERGLIAGFAELVRGPLPVADLGCGPGRLTPLLASHGLSTFGVDLSPEMIAQARKEHPELRFEVGTMASLDIPDGGLGGALVWFSTIHTAPDDLPAIFAELHRVLAPGGHLLMAFQTWDGDEPLAFDHKVTLAYQWPIGPLAALLRDAGLVERARMRREPLPEERLPTGYLLFRKP